MHFLFLIALILMNMNAEAAKKTISKGGGICANEFDCQLNGVCKNNKCRCDAAWTEKDCSFLHVLPAKKENGYQHFNSSKSSWGGGIIKHDDSNYYMFVDEINMGCGLQVWKPNSRCVLAVSAKPHGPFKYVKTLMNSFCHGSSISRDPITGYFIYNHNHIGNGTALANCTICSNGTTPDVRTLGPCLQDAEIENSQYTLISKSPLGPWTPAPKLLNGDNCESIFSANGTLFYACPKSVKFINDSWCDSHNNFLQLSSSPSLASALRGEWTTFNQTYVLAGDPTTKRMCINWEDQNIWIDKRGNFHTLMHAFRGETTDFPLPGCYLNSSSGVWEPKDCSAKGGHAFSKDGQTWYISQTVSYLPAAVFDDGSSIHFRARERPHVLIENGIPTFFISAVGDDGSRGNTGSSFADHTFTFVQEINHDDRNTKNYFQS